jgi:NADPH:quinone reductase-like Zn-dependent oxidoreductase
VLGELLDGERSLEALRPGGILVSVPSGSLGDLAAAGEARRQRVTGFLVEPDPVGLEGLIELVEAGRLQVHVDSVFGLEQAGEAHRSAEAHHGGGKIVLRVTDVG